MISSLSIKNFKCFNNLHLAISPLTLLTGFNGGGKSTALQPLLLLAQGFRAPRGTQGFPLNGPLVRLGTVGDVLPENSPAKEVEITVGGKNESIEWTLGAPAGDRMFTVSSARRDTEAPQLINTQSEPSPTNSDMQETALGSALKELIFLSAVRQAPAEAFPVPDLPSAVGLILSRFAAAGQSILVETHSDHLVNGHLNIILHSARSLTNALVCHIATETFKIIVRLRVTIVVKKWPATINPLQYLAQ